MFTAAGNLGCRDLGMLCLQQLGFWDEGIWGCWDVGRQGFLEGRGFLDDEMLNLQQLGFWDAGIWGYWEVYGSWGFWDVGVWGSRAYSSFGAVFGSPDLSGVAALSSSV